MLLKSYRTYSGAIGESLPENLLIKSQNQNIFEKFKLNRNLQTIPFKMIKMMYNMSMSPHRFSNERCVCVCVCVGGGGGGERPEPPSSLIL